MHRAPAAVASEVETSTVFAITVAPDIDDATAVDISDAAVAFGPLAVCFVSVGEEGR